MPTTNPVPSQDPSDLLFNAGKLDEVLNGTGTSFTDRLGTARRTVAGMNADFDAQLADAESDLNVYRADAAASAAQALGYLNTIRTTSYGAYASDPATDPLGNPPNVGDEYFNTTSNLLKRFNGTTWQASDINTANLAAPSGSSFVGYDGQTVQDVLDGAKSLQDYAALRAYNGRATAIRITTPGIAGNFWRDDNDTTSATDYGTIFVDALDRRWKRQYDSVVLASWFEFAANGTYEQEKFQAMLDSAKTGDTINLCGLTITLAKGAARADYPNNDQPCVVLKSKVGIEIDNGTLKVNHHGLGAIDFNSTYGCTIGENCHIEGPGLDKIPPIDGISGYAEKGVDGAGYFNLALYNSTAKLNNSVDTSSYSGGGYGGAFPQWGGGTASTWGIWNGGYIFNFGNGFTVINSDKVSFSGEAHGFNGSGVYVKSGGHICIEKKAKLHHNYIAGISVFSSLTIESVTVDDVDCYENGHPDANGALHQNIDPGYGFTSNTGSSAAKVINVKNSRFVGNKRKGIDHHAYKTTFITNNYIDDSHWGIALVPPTGSSSERAVISGNTVKNIHPSLSIRGFAIAAHGFTGYAAKSVTIDSNTVEEIGCLSTETPSIYTGGLAYGISVFGTDIITITGNTVQNKLAFGDAGILAPYTAIASGLLTVTGNGVDGKFKDYGIVAGNAVRRGIVDGNVVDIVDTGISGAAPVCLNISGNNTLAGVNVLSSYRNSVGALSNVSIKYQIFFYLNVATGVATKPTGYPDPEYPGSFALTKIGNDITISWLTQAVPKRMTVTSSINQQPLKTISDGALVDLVTFGPTGNALNIRFIKTIGGVTSYVAASDVTGECAVLLEY